MDIKKYISLFNLARVVAAVIMIQTLFFKFTGHSQSVELFTQLGVEPWGRVGTGILELIASILLFVPKGIKYGVLLTIALMLGALFTHISKLGFEGENLQLSIMAIITLVSGSYIFYTLQKK